jgi:4a-hydroxytetrahydrobiopterin dehydratase
MSDNPAKLSSSEIATALVDLPDWRTRMGGLFTVYKAASSVAAVELVHQIGVLANELDHHPDLDWRYDHVFIRSSTHSVGGAVTVKDVDLATRISALAVAAEAKPELFRTVEIGVDTADVESVRDTWAALLKYKPHDGSDLYDPWGRGPAVWFQKTDTPDPSRLHLDVWVADETADAVLAETEKAGAKRLDDRFRPSFTVIGDADGNRFCVCTSLDRAAGAN